MPRKDCNGEFATEKQKLKNIEKILSGNGNNGLVKQVRRNSDELIVQKERNSIKMWIYRSTIGALLFITGWLSRELYNMIK